jgi:quercetin dioxygenase-like cupin family protein
LVGEATWNIYLNENDKSPIQSELVKPGDVIFIPKGVFHEIYAETPRAGCSIPYPEFN